jgi:hypothetical protein
MKIAMLSGRIFDAEDIIEVWWASPRAASFGDHVSTIEKEDRQLWTSSTDQRKPCFGSTPHVVATMGKPCFGSTPHGIVAVCHEESPSGASEDEERPKETKKKKKKEKKEKGMSSETLSSLLAKIELGQY